MSSFAYTISLPKTFRPQLTTSFDLIDTSLVCLEWFTTCCRKSSYAKPVCSALCLRSMSKIAWARGSKRGDSSSQLSHGRSGIPLNPVSHFSLRKPINHRILSGGNVVVVSNISIFVKWIWAIVLIISRAAFHQTRIQTLTCRPSGPRLSPCARARTLNILPKSPWLWMNTMRSNSSSSWQTSTLT